MKFYYGTSEKMSIETNGNVNIQNLYVEDDIGHVGDADTYLSFENDPIITGLINK